jgi:hypothetical protein
MLFRHIYICFNRNNNYNMNISEKKNLKFIDRMYIMFLFYKLEKIDKQKMCFQG